MTDQKNKQLDTIDRHGWLLWLAAFLLIVALATTVQLLNARLIHELTLRGVTTEWLADGYVSGVALTGLAILFVLYTFLKQRQLVTVRRILTREETDLEDVSTRLSEVSSLFEVSTTLNLEFSLSEVLDIIVRRVLAVLKAQQASVMLYNPKTRMLETRAHYGLDAEWVARGSQKLGQGIAGRVAQRQEGILLDGRTDSEFTKHYKRHRNITSALSVPLSVDNRCLGVLNVNRIDHPEPFTDGQRQVLELFAEHVAAVIARSETLEELGQRAETLESANAKLSEVNRMKDVFLSTASHELKTPLTTVIAYAELLTDHEGQMDSTQRRDFIGRLRAEAERLLGLIEDILDLTRLETGKLTVNRYPASMRHIAAEAIETTRLLAGKHQIHFAEDLGEVDLLPLDEIKMRQVVVNLLTNAVRFSPSGGEIGISLVQDETGILLEVRDEGPGVAPEDMAQIFGLFGQGVRRTAKQKDGLGIGLHLVQRIVELHDGSVGVRNRSQGTGSTFWVRIPSPETTSRDADDEAAA